MNDDCEGCGYPSFPDFIIPFWAWIKISPSGDECGILCPNCICKRLHEKGIVCNGAFMSGPIESVSRDHMHLLRDLENLTLAIEGRRNRYGVSLAERIVENKPPTDAEKEGMEIFQLSDRADAQPPTQAQNASEQP